MDWKPINTAPKDGTRFFGFAPGWRWPEVVQWENYSADLAEETGEAGYWTYAEELIANATDPLDDEGMTHWMAIPTLPLATQTPTERN